MPYDTNEALPAPVQAHLPAHAQDIYRVAFNHAWDRYRVDAIAHRVAWAAVKRRYVKANRDWVEKPRAELR